MAYGNAHSAAVVRTLAGGTRDKSLGSSSTRVNCPLGTTLTKSSELILFFVGFPGADTQHIDFTTQENLIWHIHTLDHTTAEQLTCFFTTVDAKSFQQVAFNFPMSIRGNSAGLQHADNFYFETVPASTAFLPPEAASSQPRACPAVAQPCPQRTTITGHQGNADFMPSPSHASSLRCQLGYEILFH